MNKGAYLFQDSIEPRNVATKILDHVQHVNFNLGYRRTYYDDCHAHHWSSNNWRTHVGRYVDLNIPGELQLIEAE